MSFSLNICGTEDEETKAAKRPFVSFKKPVLLAPAIKSTQLAVPPPTEKKEEFTVEDIPVEKKDTLEKTEEKDTAVYSRKNPKPRPAPVLNPLILKEVNRAPKEEVASRPSDHIFSRENSFESFHLHPSLLLHLTESLKLTTPTAIQALAIPRLLEKSHCLIRSETGSGKTLCFVLPIVQSLIQNDQRVSRTSTGIHALCLSPTRELCVQIFDVFTQCCARPFPWLVCTSLVGGEKKKSEKARLRKGVNIVVATPGRFADHLRTTECLRETTLGMKWIVLDEADRLLDTGFEKQITEILTFLQHAREKNDTQMVLLSATITQAVEKIVVGLKSPFLRLEAQMEKGKASKRNDNVEENKSFTSEKEGEFTIPAQLMQHYCLVETADRLSGLIAFLRRHIRRTGNTCKILLFVNTRACAEFYYKLLSTVNLDFSETQEPNEQEEDTNEGLGTKWFLLHGSVDQNMRKKVLRDFSQVRGGVMICTDVAARGLDVPNVDLVLQFDAPTEITEYVHRIGRTARRGTRGQAVLFLRTRELGYLDVLNSHAIGTISPVKLTFDSLLLTPEDKKSSQASMDAKVQVEQYLYRKVNSNSDLSLSAKQAYQSWVSGYAVHASETKHLFVARELHLGHVAKSFALQEVPTKINVEVSKKRKEITSSSSKQAQYESKQEAKELKKKRLKTFNTRNEFEAE